ncbi:uncharacterized protein B0J16DRAFT_377754 [Fusarium flagelliforme]|uniref:uncharacterized protein n=1 Tax=Fusarium flagelliforme TaxID=2675880 RepID=UPI001E8DEB08|nr:uncharacterized protein B0J16DRAFT_377754 [Fusarium flagelliforme]KAH7197301.1 hypothetical protein B0J16DRAFT_377754 [Fusarium flagelliforme]
MEPPIVIDDDDEGCCGQPPARGGRADRQEARNHPYARGGRHQRQRPMLSHQNIRDTMNYVQHRPAATVIMDKEALHWQIGVFSEDDPLSAQQLKTGVTEQKRERRAGQPVYFGLSLNYETGVVDWAWRDVKNVGISPQYVTLDNGQTNITIRVQAMHQYDTNERNRIQTFNTSLITTCARRIIEKWAATGTDRDPIIHDMDRPFGLQPLELSGPTAIAESARLAQAGQLYTAGFQTQHRLFR